MLIADTEDVIFELDLMTMFGIFLHGLPVYYDDEIFNDEIEEIPERTLEGVIPLSAEELRILLEGIEKELFENNLLSKTIKDSKSVPGNGTINLIVEDHKSVNDDSTKSLNGREIAQFTTDLPALQFD